MEPVNEHRYEFQTPSPQDQTLIEIVNNRFDLTPLTKVGGVTLISSVMKGYAPSSIKIWPQGPCANYKHSELFETSVDSIQKHRYEFQTPSPQDTTLIEIADNHFYLTPLTKVRGVTLISMPRVTFPPLPE